MRIRAFIATSKNLLLERKLSLATVHKGSRKGIKKSPGFSCPVNRGENMPLALMEKFGSVGERDVVLSANGKYFYMQCGSGAAEKLRAILEKTYRRDLKAFTQLFSFLDEEISDIRIDDKRGGYYYSTIAFLEESFKPVQSGLALSLALLQKKPIFVREDFLLGEGALRDRIGDITL